MPPPKIPATRRNENGFTLPEVMMTIVVMSIVLGIATSTWFRIIESSTVDSAANQLAADLRLAHTRSTNELTDWRVQIFTDRGDPAQADYVVKGPTADLNRSLPEDSAVSSTGTELNADGGSRTLRFQSTGAVEAVGGFGDTDSDGEIRITVTVDGNPSRSLTVVPTTSRVRIVP